VYDKHGSTEPSVNIVLNDVHVDIMDYIKPAYVNEAQVSNDETDFVFNCITNLTLTPPLVPKHVDRVRVGEQGQCEHGH
jgi:coatomer subunit beta